MSITDLSFFILLDLNIDILSDYLGKKVDDAPYRISFLSNIISDPEALARCFCSKVGW